MPASELCKNVFKLKLVLVEMAFLYPADRSNYFISYTKFLIEIIRLLIEYAVLKNLIVSVNGFSVVLCHNLLKLIYWLYKICHTCNKLTISMYQVASQTLSVTDIIFAVSFNFCCESINFSNRSFTEKRQFWCFYQFRFCKVSLSDICLVYS